MSWKGDILHLMSWKEKIFSSSCPGRRYSPAHVLEGLRVWRAKQCLECLEAKACRGGEVLGQRGKYVSSKILPKFVMTNNSQIMAPSWFQSNIYIFNEASPSLFWFGSAQRSFYSSLPISLSRSPFLPLPRMWNTFCRPGIFTREFVGKRGDGGNCRGGVMRGSRLSRPLTSNASRLFYSHPGQESMWQQKE